MQVISDRSALLPPAVCFVCECTPVEGQSVVDTFSTHVTAGPEKLAGRKYVCEGCARGIAGAFGFVSVTDSNAAVLSGRQAEAALAAVVEFVKGISVPVEELVARAKSDVTPPETPKPKKAKAAPVVDG